MSRMSLTLAGFATLWLGACSFALDVEPIVANRCKTDADCAGGAICNTDVGMCISTTPEQSYEIGILVTPAPEGIAGGVVLPRALGPFPVDGPRNLDLDLPAPIRVFGTVSCDGCDLNGPLRADISFRRAGEFPGAPASQFDTNTISPSMDAADGSPANYAVALVAEREYEMVIRPTGDTAAVLPPLRRTITTEGGGDFWRLDMPYPENLETLSGRVVDAEGTPINGLRVVAIDTATGMQVSSSSQTGSDPTASGTFTLALGLDAGSYALQISGGADKPDFPTLTVSTSALFPDSEGNVEILVPTLGCVDYIGEVGVATDAMGDERVADATVTFRSLALVDAATGFTGTFRTTVSTDVEGRFSVRLPVSRADVPTEETLSYEVVISPPIGSAEGTGTSSLGVHTEAVSIGSPTMVNADGCGEAGPKIFELPDRARFNGTVRTSDDRAMPGVMVQATPRGLPFPEGHPFELAAMHNRTAGSTTGATGMFELQLDVGTYDLLVKPPAESGFPWVAEPDFTIGVDGAADIFEFSAPVTFTGLARTPLGTEQIPLGGAVIEAWALVDDGAGRRAVPIARTTAAEDGSYMLLLPARLHGQ